MMDTEERPESCPAPTQTPVRTWLSSSSRGVPGTPSDSASRFLGDGVRYKAKLIGVDPVPDAQGEKMCWDSMMKLKGFEAAARRQGKHKQRVWLKVSSSGLKIMDEKTGILLYDHDRTRISSLRKDESDPRALAYVYQHQDTYILYYIKMANLADPVLIDIKEVCQVVDQETPQESAEAPAQTCSLLLLNDSPAPPAEGPALEDVFSPDSSPGQSNQASSTNELMEIFSIQMEAPVMPTQTSCTSQSESPQPTLSSSQILSMFPTQPLRSSPYSSPPYSPTSMPWGLQGFMGNQWAGSPVGPWPTMPGNMTAWGPAGVAVPNPGGQMEAHSSQPGFMRGGNTPTSPASPTSPTAVMGHPIPLNSLYAPAGETGALQPPPPASDLLL